MTFIINCLKLAKLLKVKIFSKEEEDFFFDLTRDAFEMRKKSGVKRNDFIQLLLELKEKGSVEVDNKDLEDDEKETIEGTQAENLTKLELTDELLTAQAFVFLVAGFENTSYLSAITAYILSKHPEIQKKVRQEVREVKNKHGKIDYLALRDMKLLNACVDEVLRLHSPTPLLMRKCNKSYTLDDGVKIEKDMVVIIPTAGLHYDSKFWPDPEKFDPNRFLEGSKIHPGTYLPFGDGPRICIAQRLALVIAKMVISKVLLEFEILPSSKTKEPLKLAVFQGTDIEGGLWGTFNYIEQ